MSLKSLQVAAHLLRTLHSMVQWQHDSCTPQEPDCVTCASYCAAAAVTNSYTPGQALTGACCHHELVGCDALAVLAGWPPAHLYADAGGNSILKQLQEVNLRQCSGQLQHMQLALLDETTRPASGPQVLKIQSVCCILHCTIASVRDALHLAWHGVRCTKNEETQT